MKSSFSGAWAITLASCMASIGFGASSAPAARPGEEWPCLAEDGAWCWFSDPRAVFHSGERQRVYAGWVDSRGSVMAGALDLASGRIETFVLHEQLQKDDHCNPSLMALPDGRLMAFYSKHGGGPDQPILARAMESPEDMASWGTERQLRLNENPEYPAEHSRSYCYTNPLFLSGEAENGNLYLFWRGIANKRCMSLSPDLGLTWSPGRILAFAQGTYAGQRPYLKAASNLRDQIHLAFTDGHPRNEPTNSIYYARWRDGAFYRADGEKIAAFDALPFEPRAADVVYDARQTNVRAWVWDVAEDEDGRPVIAYTRLPAENDHRCHYARWNGERWLDREIVAAGGWFPQTPEGKKEREPHYSGGIALDPDNPSVVYLSRPINGVFEIERWETGDLGATWKTEAVTVGSRNDNVRPFAIRYAQSNARGPRALWMNNERYAHFTDYKTTIRMDFAPAP
ncbi:MAG: hypothetical protein BWZ10_01196 [candidate division BRC1 bacterium ADurb.BinA364]|nr:MAG: hypothetical protein BWZ10_01196 [candidate division BRC1 bacterium ADurb.BinA364]